MDTPDQTTHPSPSSKSERVIEARRIRLGAPEDTATLPGQHLPVHRTYRVREMPEGFAGYLNPEDVMAPSDVYDPKLYVRPAALLHPSAPRDDNRLPVGYRLKRVETGGTEFRYELSEAWPGTTTAYPFEGEAYELTGLIPILPEEMKEHVSDSLFGVPLSEE